MLESMRGQLEPSHIVHEFLALVGNAPVLPAPLRPLQKILVRAAVEITPIWVRDTLDIQGKRHDLNRAQSGRSS